MSEQKQGRRVWWLDGFGVFDENRVPVNAGQRVHVCEVLPGDEDLRDQLEEANESLAEWKELCRRAEKLRDERTDECNRRMERIETLEQELDRIRQQRNALREFEQRVSACLIEDGCGDEFWNAVQSAHDDYRKALLEASFKRETGK